MGASPSAIYKRLRESFGFLDWWPGETRFEIFAGAILTQQTSWKNVELAIANLKAAGLLDLGRLAGTDIRRLESLVRPSGFYRQKARRLKGICSGIIRDYGSLERMFRLEKGELRKALLSYSGIGDETADSIILYAAGTPVFVIDAYTRRAMHRIDPRIKEEASYEDLQRYFEDRIERKLDLYKDMHAQFVELGKRYCRARPLCADCPLGGVCDYGAQRHLSNRDKNV
jgi:endonuclease-3 related protein